MTIRTASIPAFAFVCCALLAGAPLQDGSGIGQDPKASDARSREPRGGGRGGMPLPPDWPRAGGFGPGSERPMIEGLVIEGLIPGTFGRRELNDEDLARVIAVAREVAPEWGDSIEARIKQDPAAVKSSLRTAGRRLLGLAALKERAPKVYAVKVEELRAQAATDHAAGELRDAEQREGASPEEIASLKRSLQVALEAAAARQVDATLAARQAELDALEERLKKLRADVAADVGRRQELAAEVAAEVVRRAERRSAANPSGEPRRE